MKLLLLTSLTLLALFNAFALGQRGSFRGFQAFKRKSQSSKVMCTADSLMIYEDCRICVCPRPHRTAKCFRKSCDLRTKDSGQCPATMLRMDQNKLCPGAPLPSCRSDNDCTDNNICCFDFCKGSRCIKPEPLDPGNDAHPGRGYP